MEVGAAQHRLARGVAHREVHVGQAGVASTSTTELPGPLRRTTFAGAAIDIARDDRRTRARKLTVVLERGGRIVGRAGWHLARVRCRQAQQIEATRSRHHHRQVEGVRLRVAGRLVSVRSPKVKMPSPLSGVKPIQS